MLNLNINGNELKVKFGYEATLKTRLLSRVARKEVTKENDESGNVEKIEDMLMLLPEILLVGLQKFHRSEYGFDYASGNGKEEMIDKMFVLIDDYCDIEEGDAIELFHKLQDELLSDGFLASMFRKEEAKAEQIELKVVEKDKN